MAIFSTNDLFGNRDSSLFRADRKNDRIEKNSE